MRVPRRGPSVAASAGVALTSRDRSAVGEVTAEVERLCGGSAVPSVTADLDLDGARRAVAAAWTRVLGLLSGPRTSSVVRLDELGGLLRRLKEVDDRLALLEAERHDRRLQRVRAALELLRDARQSADVPGRAVAAICELGFDRAIVSTVEDGAWLPHRVMVARDPGWAAEIEAIGTSAPMPLIVDLPETEIVRRRSAIVVRGVQERAAIHRPIATASLCRSYAAAPILHDGRVVGMLHGDAYYQGRDLGEDDGLLLALLADDVERVFAQVALTETVASTVDRLAALSGRLAPATSWGAIGPGGSGPGTAAAPDGAVHPRLTRREVEVLRCVAEGDSNARIARRLIVGEGTVKTHVKNILRKLDVANRAEAASVFWAAHHRSAVSSRGDFGLPSGSDTHGTRRRSDSHVP